MAKMDPRSTIQIVNSLIIFADGSAEQIARLRNEAEERDGELAALRESSESRSAEIEKSLEETKGLRSQLAEQQELVSFLVHPQEPPEMENKTCVTDHAQKCSR